MKINFLCLGITHHTASARLRERLSQPQAAIEAILRQFAAGRNTGSFPLQELAILSTCNRLELYACAAQTSGRPSKKTFDALAAIFTDLTGMPSAEIDPFLFRNANTAAVRHLVEVASGLDSLVLGETQILGQVSQAHEMALNTGSAGQYLSSLLRTAIHAGKRVQTETSISQCGSNLSAAAVAQAAELAGSLAEKQILVIGAGEMARLALEALHKHGARRITVTNRTLENARLLADQWTLTVQPFTQLVGLVAASDLIFSLTSAQQPLLDQESMVQAAANRPRRPWILVDLGLPRNIAPDVKQLPNVRLVDLDDLQTNLEQGLSSPQDEINHARAIVEEEARSFENWLSILPVISQLHKKAEAIRQRELERTLRRLPNPDPQINELFQLFSQSLVKKLLHDPTMHLRNDRDPNLKQYSEALEVLFDLPIDIAPAPGEKEAHL